MAVLENHLSMDINALIEGLGYYGDPGLIDLETDELPVNFAHHFQRAQKTCGLKAVYSLRSPGNAATIPLVYLSETHSEDQAAEIHRLVWNQNLVPFLIVSTPNRYVLYPGFRYGKEGDTKEIIEVIKEARLCLDKFHDLAAESIANGQIWEKLGPKLSLESRVDWVLLEELEKLEVILREKYELSRNQAHALIGKYVYLRYLRDRNILSDTRLAGWNLSPDSVFGRNVTLAEFNQLNAQLEAWLNGSVFPVEVGDKGVSEAAIQQTAEIFLGDKVSGQRHLDFAAYDFSHIPIETLSVIYQQFLHAEDKGRDKGAYYTPVPLVDLILDELSTRKPLKPGVTILDPACGSGAFLVQAYRRLIEQKRSVRGTLNPSELRQLLTEHIFGIDQDKDACQMACLSLLLTLLDYINPPDLCKHPKFKLPDLYGSNIVEGDFFQADFPWPNKAFCWIVGNPPWFKLKPNQPEPEPDHEKAIAWMIKHSHHKPVGDYQVAELFAWKTGEHLANDGVVGLLMPAMSLFKSKSPFRKAFFSKLSVWCIANFANLAPILFGGRVEVPASAFFFRNLLKDGSSEESILTYAPFLTNQPMLHQKQKRFTETWAITVNGGELRQVDLAEAINGEGLTWKIAMWGSFRDRRLLGKIAKRFPSFTEFKEQHNLHAHQGLELKDINKIEQHKKRFLEFIPEIEGKKRFLPKAVARLNGGIYGFREEFLEKLNPDNCYARKRGGIKTPLSVCQPPHLILGRSREWAVYSNEFVVVPHPQVGIAGSPGQENLLKALALYLVSNFVRYHQLFYAAEMGIQKSVADKANVESLPIPFNDLSSQHINDLACVYDRLANYWHKSQTELLGDSEYKAKIRELEKDANELVYQALGLRETERWLVEDLVNYRLQFLRGKVGDNVMKKPELDEFQVYGEALGHTLNGFLNFDGKSHHIEILPGKDFGVAVIALTKNGLNRTMAEVRKAGPALNEELEQISQRLRQYHNHWLYFERSLTLFDNHRILLIKPMQRLHWLKSQALQDADNLISDILSGEQISP